MSISCVHFMSHHPLSSFLHTLGSISGEFLLLLSVRFFGFCPDFVDHFRCAFVWLSYVLFVYVSASVCMWNIYKDHVMCVEGMKIGLLGQVIIKTYDVVSRL